MKQYVQHISGQGEKWKLRDCKYNENNNNKTWVIDAEFNISSNCMELPRSEYKICTPPEEWEDVTNDCEFNDDLHHLVCEKSRAVAGQYVGIVPHYRFRKIDGCYRGSCFIVEKRKS